jgi:tripartite-type tricarboxylate transporter receptor subunit TctC
MKRSTSVPVLAILSLIVVIAIGVVMIGCTPAKTAAYPTKPIELVVGFAPGAITDLFGRFMADELSKKWNVPINVVNKAGGNAIPAVQYMMQAVPDGYTILVDGAGTASAQALLPDLPYKIDERTFIVRVSANSHGFMIPADSPWKTLDDMTQAIKKDPAKFNWVSLGGSSTVDITTRQYLAAIGVDVSKTSPVSFPGAAPGMNEVAGGHVSLVVTNPKTELPLVQAGKARIIAVTAAERLPWLADVPTTKEQNLAAVNYQYWGAFSGPGKLPDNVINAWSGAVQDLLKDPAFVKKMDEQVGMYPFYAGPGDFKSFVLKETQDLKSLYPPAK